MPRIFNTTGPCLAEKHYMLPPIKRLKHLDALFDQNAFFGIHAPFRTGKTTLLHYLSRELTADGNYAALTVSVDGFTDPRIEVSLPQLLARIKDEATKQLPKPFCPPSIDTDAKVPLIGLRAFLCKWSAQIDRPLVIFFDEINSLPGLVLLSVLCQLRNGYCSRPAPFPNSVVLVGFKDVKVRRIDLGKDAGNVGTPSPYNIQSEALRLPDFDREEVFQLLEQHTSDTGQEFSQGAKEKIFNQSQGQPWLVNTLAARLVTDQVALVKDRNVTVTAGDVLKVREILIEQRDPHLDNLMDKLREDRVRFVIEPMLTGEFSENLISEDDVTDVQDLGLLTLHKGVYKIANPIYTEIITRALTDKMQTLVTDKPAQYVADDGMLDMPKLIQGFIKFWQENGEVLLKETPYQEAGPYLVFMAFLQRIVNTSSRIYKEYAIGGQRLDLVVDFGGRKDVIKLKRAHAYKVLEKGLTQVSADAKRLSREKGYLILFDVKAKTPFAERGRVENVEHDGVEVVILRV